jgi:hypothetical protein
VCYTTCTTKILNFRNNFYPCTHPKAEPIFRIVSCDDEGSVWKFKYTGGKGPRKIFKGSGKLAFTKQITPPHGYDYGMKSGICLKIDEQVTMLQKLCMKKNIIFCGLAAWSSGIVFIWKNMGHEKCI